MYIKQTVHWIRSMVIGLNFCPFAQREMDNNSARIEVSQATDFAAGLSALSAEIDHLQANSATRTALLIFPQFLADFFSYLDFVALANNFLEQSGYHGIYQLATFHPHYCFHGVAMDDVSNYSNRSPYPMLHILREDMLDKAIAYYGDTETIPENNIKRLQELGLAKVVQLFEQCMQFEDGFSA